MLKKIGKIVLWIALIVIYLNIGWGLGYYCHYNIDAKTFESASWQAKLLGGHCASFAKDKVAAEIVGGQGPLNSEILWSALWPLFLLLSFVSWMGHIVVWIFTGGLFKLIFGIS